MTRRILVHHLIAVLPCINKHSDKQRDMDKKLYLAIIFILFTLTVFSQTDSLDVRNLSKEEILNLTNDQLIALPLEDLVYLAGKLGVDIDDLLNQKTTVGSKKAQTPREAPGIISVISRDEIIKSGARDLIDVLQLVPGISFGYDLDGVIGLSMRGNWGLEGKILVMIDGQEINEGMYATVNFGDHFSPEQIQKIEIIRGPGSSLYGGYAELGVINIITRSASDINGIDLYAKLGTMEHALGRMNFGLQAGQKIGKTEVSVLGNYESGNRSDLTYNNFDTGVYSPKDKYFKFETENINVGIKNRGLSARFIGDNYSTHVLGYSANTTNNFTGIFTDINYKFNLFKNFELTPRVAYRRQLPYRFDDSVEFYKRAFNRLTGSLNMTYDLKKKFTLTGGFEYYHDIAVDEDKDTSRATTFYNGSDKVTFSNYALYLQAILKLGNFNIIAGGRVDDHSQGGTSFSPRLGVTAILNNFHFKLLYSKAFRAPSVENINLNQQIKPENTRVIEFETGYKITSNMFITANIFDITIKHPIIYVYNPETEYENYLNYDSTGTRGLELQYNIVYSKFSANLSYSYYNCTGKNSVDPYKVYSPEGDLKKNILQGMPAHKFTLSSIVNLTEKLSLSPTIVLWGTRYGFINTDTVQQKIDPTVTINLFLNKKDLFTKGLSVGVGIYNITNSNMLYIQPYGTRENVEKPYPGTSREYLVKVDYNFGKK
jgi:outer membrane cobalamin receptor